MKESKTLFKILGIASISTSIFVLTSLLLYLFGYVSLLTFLFIIQPTPPGPLLIALSILFFLYFAYLGKLLIEHDKRLPNFVLLGVCISILYTLLLVFIKLFTPITLFDFSFSLGYSLLRTLGSIVFYLYVLQSREFLIQNEGNESISQNTQPS